MPLFDAEPAAPESSTPESEARDPGAAATLARSRTVRWSDPVAAAAAAVGMSGRDTLRAVLGGGLPPPPIALLLGFQLVTVDEGRVTFRLDPGEHQYNPIGSVHGGVACTLLDSATGCAVHSTLPAGTGYTTLQINVNLVRAITKDSGPLWCEGWVVHGGGRVATAEGRLTDAAGQVYAHATATCLIIRPRPG